MNLHKSFNKRKKILKHKIKCFIYEYNKNIFDKDCVKKLNDSRKWFEQVNIALKRLPLPQNSLDNISFIRNNSIPKLSWCAKIYNKGVVINYGSSVHKHDNGIVEGCWDGCFSAMDYANSKHLFGSGVTITKESVVFTPPSHMYECIFCLYKKEETSFIFSNSLSFVLSHLVTDDDKLFDLVEISRDNNDNLTKSGVLSFNPLLFDDNEVSLYGFYYHNVVLSNKEMKIIPRENIVKFLNFNSYYRYLLKITKSLISNGSSKHRDMSYAPISTISKGYDSPAVSSIINKLGSFNTVTIDVDIYGLSDSGEKISQILNMPCHICKHPLGQTIDNLHEVKYDDDAVGKFGEFIATLGLGDDLVFLSFDKYLSNKAVFSGALGDTIWNSNEPPPYGLPVRIIFGKSLSEYRLRKGFIHIPLPVIGATFPCYIYRINFLRETKPFFIQGNYNRPIPRRIIEESNIPRDFFAIEKNAINPNPINLKKFKKEAFKIQISKYSFMS